MSRILVKSLRNLLNRVVALNQEIYGKIYAELDHYITPKIDGEHGVIGVIPLRDSIYFTLLIETEIVFMHKMSADSQLFCVECEIVNGNTLFLIDIVAPYDYKTSNRKNTIER